VTAPAVTVARRVKWEQKMYFRSAPAAGFTFAFPLLFLVIFIAINGNNTVHVAGGRVKFAQYYVPAIITFGLISACYTNLATTLVFRRQLGILKRVRGTPLSPSAYIAGLVGNVIVVSLILAALTLTLGLLAYGVTFPGRYLGFVVAIALGAFCFSALGMAVSTFVPNEDAAPAIINFLIFPLLFLSGTFGPVSDKSALAKIAVVFPVRHLLKEIVAVFNPFGSGTGIVVTHAVILAAGGVGAVLVALRRFRWEPRPV
jgi:ABC-2 type transport system permease protein